MRRAAHLRERSKVPAPRPTNAATADEPRNAAADERFFAIGRRADNDSQRIVTNGLTSPYLDNVQVDKRAAAALGLTYEKWLARQ